MNTPASNAPNTAQPAKPKKDMRVAALRRFAGAITILTCFGHALLGFEAALIMVAAALGTTYSFDLLIETVEAWAERRPARYRGGLVSLIDFLLPAHISGLAVAMLLYSGGAIMPVVFASAVAMASKAIFKAPMRGRWRHFLNPSNAGIAITLLLFGWVGIAPPYQFTENFAGGWDLFVPAIIIGTGTLLNGVFTGRLPLIVAWLGGFALQAVVRSAIFETPIAAALGPMTGMAFLLYTFYMISDPGTTPFGKRNQVLFGLSVAAMYAVMMTLHVVFTLFFALLAVCVLRGLGLFVLDALARVRSSEREAVTS